MAIEKKSLISSTPAAKSTASKLATTKKVNDKMNADGLRAASKKLTKAASVHTAARILSTKAGGIGHSSGLQTTKSGVN
jgi:hypothetical protein